MVELATLGFGALLLVFLAVTVLTLRKVLAAPRAAPETGSVAGKGSTPAPDTDSKLIARIVLDEQGKPAGETVRVEGDDVVLKREGLFLVVPKGSLHDAGEKLRAEGVDWAAAGARGEAWRRRQEDVMKFDDKGMPILEK